MAWDLGSPEHQAKLEIQQSEGYVSVKLNPASQRWQLTLGSNRSLHANLLDNSCVRSRLSSIRGSPRETSDAVYRISITRRSPARQIVRIDGPHDLAIASRLHARTRAETDCVSTQRLTIGISQPCPTRAIVNQHPTCRAVCRPSTIVSRGKSDSGCRVARDCHRNNDRIQCGRSIFGERHRRNRSIVDDAITGDTDIACRRSNRPFYCKISSLRRMGAKGGCRQHCGKSGQAECLCHDDAP